MIAFALLNGIHWHRLTFLLKKFFTGSVAYYLISHERAWFPPTISYTQNDYEKRLFSPREQLLWSKNRLPILWNMSSIILHATWKEKIWTFPGWALNRSKNPFFSLFEICEYLTSRCFKRSLYTAPFHFSQNFRLKKWFTPR